MHRHDRIFAAAIALYVVVLAALPLTLSPPFFHWLFSEEGPIEKASIVFWIFAAIVVLVRTRPLGANAWAFALLFAIFAAREADLHRAFTADSMFKSAYYRHVPASFAEKLVAGIVAIAIILLLVRVLWISIRFLWHERGWRTRCGAWLLAGLVLLVFTKVLDRTPAVLADDFGIRISPLLKMYADAFEEGLEAVLPLMFAFSAWIARGERNYLAGKTEK